MYDPLVTNTGGVFSDHFGNLVCTILLSLIQAESSAIILRI
jgi:hypothetical protein